MSQDDVELHRSWQELAKLTAEQQDSTKALKLAQELIRALDEESSKRMDKLSAAQKNSDKGAHATSTEYALANRRRANKLQARMEKNRAARDIEKLELRRVG